MTFRLLISEGIECKTGIGQNDGGLFVRLFAPVDQPFQKRMDVCTLQTVRRCCNAGHLFRLGKVRVADRSHGWRRKVAQVIAQEHTRLKVFVVYIIGVVVPEKFSPTALFQCEEQLLFTGGKGIESYDDESAVAITRQA